MALSDHIRKDSPTNNFATLNALDTSGGTLSNGNLSYQADYSNSRNGNGVPSTIVIPNSGKWYVECNSTVYSGVGNSALIGITSWKGAAIDNAWYAGTSDFEFHGVDANIYSNKLLVRFRDENGVASDVNTQIEVSSTYGAGNIVMLAYDLNDSTKKLWVGYQGTWYNGGDPAAGTNPTYTFTSSTDSWKFWAESIASVTNANRSPVHIDFGQGFQYSIPSEYKTVSANNLEDITPDVSGDVPGDYFKSFDYIGDGNANRQITGLGFKPDFIWIKRRDTTSSPALVDSVRGGNKTLRTTSTDSEFSSSPWGAPNSFDSDGWTFTNGSNNSVLEVNASSGSYIAWCWKAGGAPSGSNIYMKDDVGYETLSAAGISTAGTITPTAMSVNTKAGFSIVKYTGNSTNGATVPHGLNKPIEFLLCKQLSDTSTWESYAWNSWHIGLSTNNYIQLNTNNQEDSYGPIWVTSGMTDNVFTHGNVPTVMNRSTGDYIAYCWHSVAGYSAFGSYTGNGSTDGPFIYTGFKPAWVMIKRTDVGGNWLIQDSVRTPFNWTCNMLTANISSQENTTEAELTYGRDYLSNGFKIRASHSSHNATNGTYIYAAFAEQPLKYATAR